MSAAANRFGSALENSVGPSAVIPRPRAGAMSDADAEFTMFFRAEFARVARTVSLIVGDRGHGEEIAQDAFVRLLDHWEKVSGYERPDAWVRRVAIRLATRATRRERMRQVLEDRFLPAGTTSGNGESDCGVAEAVCRLPPGQRAAVVLFYFEDRPVIEVAQLLGCSPATAKVHLHRARRRLATLLGEGVDDVA